jgi:Amt family ammonium transporter
LLAVLVTVVYSLVVTYIIYKLVDLIIKVRVPERDENLGLDLTQHHENAYTVIE